MIVGLGLGVAASSHFVVSAVAEVIRTKKGIVAIGNAQVDTAQSKFGGASALFDGTGDYLVFPNNTITASDDFTLEAWIRLDIVPPSSNNWQMLFGNTVTGGNAIYMAIKNNAGTITSDIVLSDGSGNFIEEEKTISSISANTWYHWAICKSGSTLKHFFNGTELTTTFASIGTMTSAFGAHSLGYIGRWSGNTSWMWDGHIDELRVSNTARYTTGFTPSTTPFQNDENTLLLLHMDGTDGTTVFEDDNGVRAKKGVIAFGNAQVDTAQSKFGGTSFLGDGTGDYLKVTNNGELDFGTGDFTIEWWQYLTSLDRFAIDMRGGSNGAKVLIYSYPTDGSATDLYYYVSSSNRISASGCISANVWQHIAVSRSGTSTKMFVDGTQVGSTYTDSTNYDNADLLIWENQLSAGNYTPPGHIDEFRISNTARYTTGFTPSTTPFVNDDNTLLLLHMDGTDASTYFEDDVGVRAKLGVVASGNAQVDTAQSKFGGASALFDGADDYLLAKPTTPTTSDFTMECWFRPANISSGYRSIMAFGNESSGRFVIYQNGSQVGCNNYGANTYDIIYNSAVAANTWYHIALVRSSGTLRLYLDGVYSGEKSASGVSFGNTGGFYVGNLSTLTDDFNGWIDEVRFSDSARYTTTFTPSTTPFQNDSNTLLLLHMDGTDGSTVFTDDNGVPPDYDYGA